MKKEEAEKLYQLSENGYHVIYNTSPYVASVDSGRIEKQGKEYIYRDSAVIDVPVLQCATDEFDVYERHDEWQDVKFPFID